MLRPISRPTTLSLLEQLTPSLVSRARWFSQPAHNLNSTRTPSTGPNGPRKSNGSVIDPNLRDQMLAARKSRRFLPSSSAQKYNTTLVQVSEAIKAKDLLGALTSWQELEKDRRALKDLDAYRLPVTHIRDLHKLFVNEGLKVLRENPGEGLAATARDFALQAAKHHSAEALSVLMVHYIKANDPHAALHLYEVCVQTLGVLGPSPTSTDASEEPDTKTETTSEDSLLSLSSIEEVVSQDLLDPGRVSVILSAITAHAMLDSFKPAFELYKSAGVSVSKYRRDHFLQYLSYNVPLLRKVKVYINRVTLASLISRPISFTKHVTNLGEFQTTDQLMGFYDRIINGLFGPESYIAASPSQLPSSPNLLAALDESSWTALQTAFIKCGRIDLAAKIWDDLSLAQVKPGRTMWTGLLDSHAGLRNSTQAKQTWEMMLAEGIQPDHLSYRALIHALMDDGRFEEGMQMFKEYQETLGGRDGEELGRPVYNTVLHGLLRMNRIEAATLLLEDMDKHGPKPDLFSYNTLLAYHARQKDFNALSGVLTRMSSAKISSDVVTFSTILSALLAVGRKEAPSTIMSLMRKQGIKPNVATYTAIIDSQMREESEANLNAALSLLDKMEKEDGIKPNEVTYTAILAGLYRGDWISRSQADVVRTKIVQRMRADNVTFSLSTYHILMRSALDSVDEEGYLDALRLLQEMEKASVPRVGSTWYILLAGLMSRRMWDVANEVVEKVWHSGHKPSKSLLGLMKNIKAKHKTGRVLGQS